MKNIMNLFRSKYKFNVIFEGGIDAKLRFTIMNYLESIGARCDEVFSFGNRIRVSGESFKTNDEIGNGLRKIFTMIDVRKTKNGIFISNKDEA